MFRVKGIELNLVKTSRLGRRRENTPSDSRDTTECRGKEGGRGVGVGEDMSTATTLDRGLLDGCLETRRRRQRVLW